MNNKSIVFLLSLLFTSALFNYIKAQNQKIYKAKTIYIADTAFHTAEAMLVQDGFIQKTGTFQDLTSRYPKAEIVDYSDRFIYPGFIDAHCHFLGYAMGLNECNLVGTTSEKDVLKKLKKFSKSNKRTWIVGRGWDQNDWKNKQYPGIEALDKAFPKTPVCLSRVDGHAIWINSAAVKALKLDLNQQVAGGEILFVNGKFSGILIDNAEALVTPFIPEQDGNMKTSAIAQAAKKCYATGLTTVDDAGLNIREVLYLKNLQESGKLSLRIYAMLSYNEENIQWLSENGRLKTSQLSVTSMKFYLDGALGSRGALMKQDYCDRPGHRGLLLTNTADFFNYSHFLYSKGFQVCVHAIGDSANKIALQTFSKLLPQGGDPRWRIEHAQITDPSDMKYYRSGNIIPSIQPTHATSDAPWAPSRLCENRLAGAYANQSLLKQAGIVALGTDFPVENISPIYTFYSAVTRLDAAGKLKEPFLPQQALSRKEALWGMTLWAAYANFEEMEKGSLETGKVADFVVSDVDLMTAPDNKIPKIQVLATYIAGKLVYKR